MPEPRTIEHGALVTREMFRNGEPVGGWTVTRKGEWVCDCPTLVQACHVMAALFPASDADWHRYGKIAVKLYDSMEKAA